MAFCTKLTQRLGHTQQLQLMKELKAFSSFPSFLSFSFTFGNVIRKIELELENYSLILFLHWKVHFNELLLEDNNNTAGLFHRVYQERDQKVSRILVKNEYKMVNNRNQVKGTNNVFLNMFDVLTLFIIPIICHLFLYTIFGNPHQWSFVLYH